MEDKARVGRCCRRLVGKLSKGTNRGNLGNWPKINEQQLPCTQDGTRHRFEECSFPCSSRSRCTYLTDKGRPEQGSKHPQNSYPWNNEQCINHCPEASGCTDHTCHHKAKNAAVRDDDVPYNQSGRCTVQPVVHQSYQPCPTEDHAAQ